jgi:hypothetical protein
MGPLPSAADFAAAAAAAAADDAGEGAASDSSAATVEVQLAGEDDWQRLPIESKTIGVRLPEGYRLPAAAAAEGDSKNSEGHVQVGDVQMGDGQEQHAAADADVGGGRKRRREEAEAVIKQVEEDTQGAVRMWLLPGSAGGPAEAVPVCMECTAQPANATAAGEGADTAGTAGAAVGDAECSSSSSPWKRLKLLLPASYPQQPPVLVFQPGKALAGPEEQQQKQQQNQDSAVYGGSTAPQGATGQQQQQLAEEAWAELQAALWEEPLTDLKGVAKHWCQAVGAVVVQRGLLPSSSR